MINLFYLAKETTQQIIYQVSENYSPWAFADEITRLAEKGEAKPVESRKIVDLKQFFHRKTWAESLSSLFTIVRKVHVVNDERLIKEALVHSRSGSRFSIYPTIIDSHIGDKGNMLVCSQKDHSRLRKPFEHLFANTSFREKGVLNRLSSYIFNFYSTGSSGFTALNESGELAKAIKESGLCMEEKTSSLAMFEMAGVFTSESTGDFIHSLLENNPDCVDKIYSEWKEQFGDCLEEKLIKNDSVDKILKQLGEQSIFFAFGGEYKEKAIPPSKTLEAFFNEVVRLYPVIPQIMRIANERFTLGETAINPGDVVVLNVMGYQRDLNRWENPTEFNPDRFMTDKRTPSLLNFGYGAERCIGQHLAKRSLILFTLANVIKLKSYEFKNNKRATHRNNLEEYIQNIDELMQKICKNEDYKKLIPLSREIANIRNAEEKRADPTFATEYYRMSPAIVPRNQVYKYISIFFQK
jgi:cytochrome P450